VIAVPPPFGSVIVAVAVNAFAVKCPETVNDRPGAHARFFPDAVSDPAVNV